MAAITYAIQTSTAAGDNIVSISQLYGGTYNLFMHAFSRQGIEVRMAAFDDYEGLKGCIEERTRAVFLESIAKPAGNIVHIARIAQIAPRHRVPGSNHNTIAQPFLCRPYTFGAR